MIHFKFINEWRQLFSKGYNWKNYHLTFFNVECEDDVMMASYDLTIVVLGLGIEATYSTGKKTPEMIQIERTVDAYKSGEETGTPWEEVQAQLMEGRCPRCYFCLDGSEKK